MPSQLWSVPESRSMLWLRIDQKKLHRLGRRPNCLDEKGEVMPEQKEQNVFTVDPPSHRLDVPLHDLLMKPAERSSVPLTVGPPQTLPEPVFPQKPELMAAP